MLLFAAVSAQTVTLTFTGRDASNQSQSSIGKARLSLQLACGDAWRSF